MHSSLYLYHLIDFSKMFRISCYHVNVLVYTKTPKTPRQKPPPKIPNWLTKIPGKNPQKSLAKILNWFTKKLPKIPIPKIPGNAITRYFPFFYFPCLYLFCKKIRHTPQKQRKMMLITSPASLSTTYKPKMVLK